MLLELSPADIRFMHARINDKFKNGNSVNETIEMIASGEWKLQCLPRIRVVKMKGCYYTFDNRRLYVYRVLHYRGLLQTVKVHLAPMHQFQPHKLSTKNKGKSVTICRGVTLKHCEDENSWTTIIRDDSIRDDDDDDSSSNDDYDDDLSSDNDDDFYFIITKPKQNSAIAGWRSSIPTTSSSTSSSSLYRPRAQQYSRTSLMASTTSANSTSHISSDSLYARSNIRPYSVSTSQTTPSATSPYVSSQQPKSSDGLRPSYLITSNRLEQNGLLNPYDRSDSTSNGSSRLFTQPRDSSYNSAIAGWRSSISTTSSSTSSSSLYRPLTQQCSRTSLMANTTSANSTSHISSDSLYARSNIRSYSVSTSQTTPSATSPYGNSQQPKSSDGLRPSYLITSNRLEQNGLLNPYDRSHSTSNGSSRLFTQPRGSNYNGTSLSSYEEDKEKHGSVHSSYDCSHSTSNGTRGFSTHPGVSSYLGTTSSSYGDNQERYGNNASRFGYTTTRDVANSRRKSDDGICTIL